MILADKIVELRKQNNWSQEELAGRLGVSRQAISKWESAQSVPDLNRILDMSRLFGVSTDYLIKDEIENCQNSESAAAESDSTMRMLSLEEARQYIDLRRSLATNFALAVALCILAPALPFCLSTMPIFNQHEGILFIIALLFIAPAVAILLHVSFRLKPYGWIRNDRFELEYGVQGAILSEQKHHTHRLNARIIIAVVCYFAALGVLILSSDLEQFIGWNEKYGLAVALIFVAVGTYLIIHAYFPYNSCKQILQQDGYRSDRKEYRKGQKERNDHIESIYWLSCTAIYLAWSFVGNAWARSWIIWPCAAVIYGILSIVLDYHKGPKE